MGTWTEEKTAFHKEWSRAVDGPYYRRDDKPKWFALERLFLEAEAGREKKLVQYYLDAAKNFADEAYGGASWPGGKPGVLCD